MPLPAAGHNRTRNTYHESNRQRKRALEGTNLTEDRPSCRDTVAEHHEPRFRERIQWAARRRALESLGIVEPKTRLAEIKLAKEELDEEENTVLHAMGAQVLGADHRSYAPYGLHAAVENAILNRQKVHEKELLAAEPLGQRILELQHEQEDLLDTVWLATSPVQIKQLWSRVAEILDQQPTALQQHAFALEPVPDNDA